MNRLLLLGALLAAAPAAADPVPMSAGAQPRPMTSSTVRIAREELAIGVDRKAAEVNARLELENRGAAQTLQVGFPCDAKVEPGIAALDCKTPLQVIIDGKKVKARRKGQTWLWPMRFAAGQKTLLVVHYRSKLVNERYETPYLGMGAIHYRLVTGAAWAGPIGELAITVTLPTDLAVWITPAGYVRSHGRVEWRLTAVEPAGDVAIFFHTRLLGRGTGTRDERRALAHDLRGAGDEIQQWVETLHRVTQKTLALPAPTAEDVRATVEASARLYEEES